MSCYKAQTRINTAFDWRLYASRCESLKWLRRNRIHVDTVVSTKDGFSENVHWQVLSALCPKLIEASEVSHDADYKHLLLPDSVNGIMAHQLVDCAYGEKLNLEGGQLQDLFKLAVEYEISQALKICLDCARKSLTVNNCIKLYLISIEHRHHALRRACYSMMRNNFKLLVQVNPDFHLLSCEQLKQLLQDNHLKLDEDEEFAWLAIERWTSKRLFNQVNAYNILNQMLLPVTAIPAPTRTVSASLARSISSPSYQTHTYSPIVPMEHSDDKVASQDRKFSWASNFVQSSRSIEDSHDLAGLLKCLRFMRFRSINAFNVILANNLIRRDESLMKLVLLMKLRYAIRKKVPLADAQLDMISPDLLERIRLSETTRTQRFIEFITKIIICRWSDRGTQQAPATELIQNLDDTDEKPGQKVEFTEQHLELLDQDCLHRAITPRIPRSVGLLIGGWQEGSVKSTMLAYDFVYDKWFKLNMKLPEPRAFHAACISSTTGQLFVFGGTDGNRILNSVIRFNSTRNIQAESTSKLPSNKDVGKPQAKENLSLSYRFHPVCPMNESRCHLSGLFHTDGRLYALGGHSGTQRLRSCERLDLKSNQWHPIAEMILPRSDSSACSHGNKIFIAGGQIGDQFIQSSVEFYKPSDNTWTLATPMIVPRMSFKLVSYKNHLLAIGGTNFLYGTNHGEEVISVTKSVERYDANLASWSLCSPMNQKRSSFGIMNIENKLIVVGGHSGRKRLKGCEQLKIRQMPMNASTSSFLEQRFLNLRRSQSFTTSSEPATIVQRRNSIAGTNLAVESSNFRIPDRHIGSINNQSIRNTMRWLDCDSLPSKRSGFSICVVTKLKNAQDFTYNGLQSSAELAKQGKPTVIKQPSRWSRFKIIKRRKLIKNLKIAIVVVAIILLL